MNLHYERLYVIPIQWETYQRCYSQSIPTSRPHITGYYKAICLGEIAARYPGAATVVRWCSNCGKILLLRV